MNKIFKRFVLLSVLVVVSLALVGCGKTGLVGKWEYEGGGYTYTFNADGTGSYEYLGSKMEFTYTTEDNKLSILYTGNTTAFETEYSIDGNTLNIKDSFGSDTLYTRK